MHILFFLTACVSIFAVVLICVFLFANGIPAIGKIGVFKFLLGTKWKPGNDIYGILPMILGSLYVTAGAIIIGVPIGLLTAVFLAKFCPKGLYKILKPATELMAGVPSVVYGFFGLVVLVPLVQNIFGVAGNTMLTASVLLGIGRAIGETMAVVMVAGNKPRMPQGLLDGVRTMTANIVMEMGYATDLHREALIATAVVLFVFILIINVTFSLLRRKDRA